MAAFRLDLIGRYLRPHRRTVCLGAVALVIVNMLSVTIPLEVRRVIDDLQGGFAFDDVLRLRAARQRCADARAESSRRCRASRRSLA